MTLNRRIYVNSINQHLGQYNQSMSFHDLLHIASSRKTAASNGHLPAPITDLVSKIQNISSSIDLNLSKNSLHMLGLQNSKNHNRAEDPLTKLKNIENKSQINRAQVELMIQRRPKRYSIKSQKPGEDNIETYLDIYKQLKEQKVFKDRKDTDFNSQDEISQPNQTPPRNIKHYHLLRQHPKVLQFTMEKMKDRNSAQKLQSQKQLQKTMINQASRPNALLFNEQFREIIENLRKDQVDPLSSPKAIVENQLTKFYSKSSKGKTDAKIRQNPRCNMFLQRQEEILMKAQSSKVSKQNMKKLKERLNGIVNQMNKDDKNASKQRFPRLASSVNSSHIKSISQRF